MLHFRFVPRTNWASVGWLGRNVAVYDENNEIGFWTGGGGVAGYSSPCYAPAGGYAYRGTFANRRSPSANWERGTRYGEKAQFTDIGPFGNAGDWINRDGVWRPSGGRALLCMWPLPVGMPPSGSVSANGIVTLNAPGLPVAYVVGSWLWLYFKLGALYAGSAAGFWQCEVLSQTSVRVLNQRLTVGNAYNWGGSGLSVAPTYSTPTPYVQLVAAGTEFVTHKWTIPGSLLNYDSALDVRLVGSCTNQSAGGLKTPRIRIDNQIAYNTSHTSQLGLDVTQRVWGALVGSLMLSSPATVGALPQAAASPGNNYSMYTSSSKVLQITVEVANPADSWMFDFASVEIIS